MDFAPSSQQRPVALKVLIAGGFGVGKTTLVSSCSEILPLRTEEHITTASIGTDDLTGVEAKTTTTVVMDFGRIRINDDIVLYLFGTPGQERFWFLWDELVIGALGAVVMADTRRLADCFPSLDYFENRGTAFLVAVNCFFGEQRHSVEKVRKALDLDPGVPVVLCDARDRESSKQVLLALMQYVRSTRPLPVGR
ncbi:MAG: ATP/GTP-binding protein [Micromonosporaceae bacterium]|nr:ATP/GTP-binding protein [Micromonosporaceae bacterium]